MRVLLPSIALLLAATLPAHGSSVRLRDLPIRDSRVALPAGGRAWAGDVLEIRLGPAAARLVHATPERRARELGLARVDALARVLGATFEPEFRAETAPPEGSGETDFTAFYLVHLAPGARLEEALERFAALPEVAAVSPIAILRSTTVPGDSLWSQSKWFEQPSDHDIDAAAAWDVTTGDNAIVVALLDSGVLPYHPDLGGSTPGSAGQIWTNPSEISGAPGVDDDGNGFVDDVHGWDFVDLPSAGSVEPGEDWENPDNDPNDFAAHGTGCAGLIGALTDNGIGVAGTAWRVRIMPLRVSFAFVGSDLGESEPRMDWAAQAIRYATRQGARVISCSFETIDTGGLGAAATAAVQAGVTIVTSAGNFGSPFHELGLREDVIAVAATDSNDIVAPFSNTGAYVDLAAPGADLWTTWLGPRPSSGDSVAFRQPGYARFRGTSAAAPLVSGAVALLQARQRQLGRDPLPPMAALLRLTETADSIAAQNPSPPGPYGSGRLNLYRALTETHRSTAVATSGVVRGAPALVPRNDGSSLIVFASSNATLVGLDAATMDTSFFAGLLFPPAPTTRVAAGPIGGGRVGFFVAMTNGRVAAVDDKRRFLTGWPAGGPGGKTGGPALGVLGGDSLLDVVIGGNDGQVHAWRLDGGDVPGFPAAVASAAIRAPVAVGDVDGLPGAEIVAAAEDGTVMALDGAGAPLPGWESIVVGGVPVAPVITRYGPAGDVFVFVAAGSELHAFAPDGTERPGFPFALSGGTIEGLDPALGDLDGNDGDEVVVVTSASTVEVVDSVGVSLPGWPRALPGLPTGSPLVAPLAAGAEPAVLVRTATGLVAVTAGSSGLPGLPRHGTAAGEMTIGALDADDAAEILSGSGSDSISCLYAWDTGPRAAPVGFPDGRPWTTARGNAARSGSRFDAPAIPVLDVRAPAAVSDLAVARLTPTHVVLRWTAPGDDDSTGIAALYDLRRSPGPITAANFSSLPGVAAGTPSPATAPESLVLALPDDETAYFALRAVDESGNAAPISNVASIGPAVLPPTRIALSIRTNPVHAPVPFDFRAAPGGQTGRQELEVFDVTGRRVRTYRLDGIASGSIAWDGRDANGNAVSRGLYFVRWSSGGSTAQLRLVLLP